MFEHFGLNQRTRLDTSLDDDDDPPSSPKTNSCRTTSVSPTTSPAALHIADGSHMGDLVRKMSKQTFIRDSLNAQLSLSSVPMEPDVETQGSTNQTLPQMRTSSCPGPQLDEPIAEAHLSQPVEPIVENHLIQESCLRQPSQKSYAIIENPLDNSPIFNSVPRAIEWGKSQGKSETHLGGPAKPRALDLMTNMIENGIQCNIHAAGPSTASMPTSQPPISDNYVDALVSKDDDPMDLEVDMDYCTQDGEAAPSEALTLRDAGAPAGIKKFGFLKYRSSLEAASRSNNMKKNVPRMRRRVKTTKRPNSEVPSNSNSTAV
ncbi:uncharacterized protein GGS25DRAFT_499768 [Hypoxylon fragiforme]|uniref:uncharacterized protein n=1 Tax=Hypoxylon fragiforme TaxID=63214 RepID=UPI0020C5E21A|nr:uncharacterized protein GGS25DRAFT_499768 [Hypoxylon fragiforme]KAI2606152.1 hypothetical protein GGS25DRAFT_499768 [Hypoxylon fragiforme]